LTDKARVQAYIKYDTYLDLRQRLLESIDERIENVLDTDDWDTIYKTLTQAEQIINTLEKFDSNFGLGDDDDD